MEIRHRLPGFCAFRYLEDGDVLIALETPTGELPFHSSDGMMSIVRACVAGRPATFKILHHGAIRPITLILNARPLETNRVMGDTNGFVAGRNEAAQTCWDELFAPLVEMED